MEKAVKITLARAAKLYEKDKRFFAYYADILTGAGEKQKAYRILTDNINLFPKYSTGELVLGEMFFNQKKYDKAEMLFKGALKKDDSCVKAYRYLSLIEEMKGNKDTSLQMLKLVARLDPFDADARNIIMLSDKEFSFSGEVPPPDDDLNSRTVLNGNEEIEAGIEIEEKLVSHAQEDHNFVSEEILHKLDSSEDIEIPEFASDEKEDIIRKHNISEEALNRERSFSEDIIESLDGLTQSFIEERNSFAAFVDEKKEEEKKNTGIQYSDLVAVKDEPDENPFDDLDAIKAKEETAHSVPADTAVPDNVISEAVPEAPVHVEADNIQKKDVDIRELDTLYKDNDPKIESLLNELVLSPEMYKVKMESLSKIVDEDPRNYDNLVDFAIARYKFAAATVKREIQYYSKKVSDEPKNTKYSQNLKSYREEILKLNADLKEEMNVLKNEYY